LLFPGRLEQRKPLVLFGQIGIHQTAHKVGTHRRVRYQNLVDYKVKVDTERLAVQAQELSMSY